MQIRRRAKEMYQFRKKHRLPGDDKLDYYTAEHFERDNYWQEQLKKRKTWEIRPRHKKIGGKKIRIPKSKVRPKELFYCYLQNIIFGWHKGDKK